MDFGPLRALALDLNLSAHGVDVIVTVPEGAPVETRGIWLTPLTDGFPSGGSHQRHEPVRIMALRREDVPAVPRGTLIVGPEKSGGVDQTWKVDGLDRLEADHARVIVVPFAEST